MRAIAPGPDLAHDAGAARVGPHALGLQRAQQLADQQRVAAGRAVHGGREGVVGLRPERPADELADRGAGQRPGADRRGRQIGGDLADERRVGARLRAPRGDREQDRQALEPPRQVGEEAQRRAVAPVQVVDREHERPVAGEVEQQPVEAVQRRERRVAVVARRRLEHGAGARAPRPPARARAPRGRRAARRAAGARRRRGTRARAPSCARRAPARPPPRRAGARAGAGGSCRSPPAPRSTRPARRRRARRRAPARGRAPPARARRDRRLLPRVRLPCRTESVARRVTVTRRTTQPCRSRSPSGAASGDASK